MLCCFGFLATPTRPVLCAAAMAKDKVDPLFLFLWFLFLSTVPMFCFLCLKYCWCSVKKEVSAFARGSLDKFLFFLDERSRAFCVLFSPPIPCKFAKTSSAKITLFTAKLIDVAICEGHVGSYKIYLLYPCFIKQNINKSLEF